MKVFFDTSVLIAALIEKHTAHPRSFSALQDLHKGSDQGFVAAHSIAELYATLTRIPVQPRISPSEALRLLETNLLGRFEIVALSAHECVAVVKRLSDNGIIGGVTYDALIVYSAIKADADKILTLNVRDFRRIFPEVIDKITTP